MVSRDFRRLAKEIKEETPLFNLIINLEGWQGPFNTFLCFESIAERADEYRSLKGMEHYVSSDGSIRGPKKDGLHTFRAALNLTTPEHLDITSKIGLPNKVLRLLSDPFQIDAQDLPKHPIYTLKGMYAALPNQDRETKMEAIIREFSFRNTDITLSEIQLEDPLITLAWLENNYMHKISDQ